MWQDLCVFLLSAFIAPVEPSGTGGTGGSGSGHWEKTSYYDKNGKYTGYSETYKHDED